MRFLGTKGKLAVVATATLAVLVPTTIPTAAAATTASATTTPVVRWVKADKVTVTAKPWGKSRTVARPDDGTRLRVLDRSGGRLQVRLPNGRIGWVTRSATTASPLRDITGTRFTRGEVAAYKDLFTSKTVSKVRLGTKITMLARTTDQKISMVKVRVPGGRTGWVRTTKLTKRDVWGALARCESGGNPRTNTGNGYYGLYQFTASTWHAMGGKSLPHRNSGAEQTKRAQILQDRAGWGQWPACTRKLGLR